jgi:hypothetical protein
VYRRVVVPFAVLVITLGIMNTWMFTLPMMHRV